MINIVDPDQLGSKKPADLDLHCFQNRIKSGCSQLVMDNISQIGYTFICTSLKYINL